MRRWRVHSGNLDEIPTSVTIHALTESMPPAIRLYWEMMASGHFAALEAQQDRVRDIREFSGRCGRAAAQTTDNKSGTGRALCQQLQRLYSDWSSYRSS